MATIEHGRITFRELSTIVAALENWKEELNACDEFLADSLYFAHHTPLSIAEVDALIERLQIVRESERVAIELIPSLPAKIGVHCEDA